MYEVIKTVKGYNITRMIGTRGFYHVVIGCRDYTFKTIKSATSFCETM